MKKSKLIILFLFLIFQGTNVFSQINDQTWMDLDGSNDFLDFGTDSILSGKTQFTVEMKIHLDNSSGDFTILGQRTSDINRTIVLQRWAGAFYVFLSNTNWGSCSFIPCESSLYHLAIAYDGNGITNTDRLKLYINGQLQVLTFSGTIDLSTHTTSPAANLVLGCEHNGVATQLQFFDGQIGEFCVWDFPMNASQISNRVASEVVGNETGLTEFFHFDNGVPGGNNTAITSFTGGNSLSTITPVNMTMNGSGSNFTGRPVLISAIDTTLSITDTIVTSNSVGATYQWLDCNNGYAAIPGAVSQNYTASANGNYAVQVTLGACIDTSVCGQITTVGISSLQEDGIFIYPNPFSDYLKIENKNNSERVSIEILNSIGEIVYFNYLTENTVVQTNIYPPGIYLLKLKSGEKTEVFKIVKK